MSKVCAAIVTFNRKFLLERCIVNLLEQTSPISQILVVDNHSSDGSFQYIKRKFDSIFKKKNITFKWVRLKENLGGAGGFNKAVEHFLFSNEEFLWLMDDDGYPEKDALTQLLLFANGDCFIGPIVLSDRDGRHFSFPLRIPNSIKMLDTVDDIPPSLREIKGTVLPFNGTLISRELILKIGLPDGRYFIWGDEIDYMERARRSRAYISTITAAKFFHPKAKNLGSPMFFNLLRFNDTDSKIKLYCYCRNNFVNQRKYRGFYRALFFVGKVFWFYSITSPSASKLKIARTAIFHAVVNNFSQHKKYLG